MSERKTERKTERERERWRVKCIKREREEERKKKREEEREFSCNPISTSSPNEMTVTFSRDFILQLEKIPQGNKIGFVLDQSHANLEKS